MAEISLRKNNLYYDYERRWYPLKVLGFFVLLEKPKLHLNLHISLLICVISLYVYLIVISVRTMYAMSGDTTGTVKAFYTLGTVLVGLILPYSKLVTLRSTQKAAEILRQGVFTYEHLEEELNEIRRTRILQVKRILYFILGGYITIGVLSLVTPVMRFLMRDDYTEYTINPYLPLPLMVPFNSYSALGFSVAYGSEAIAILFFHFSNVSAEDMYLSSVMQLGLEFELLSYSLLNIEKRAYLKLRNDNPRSAGNVQISELYDSNEFQNCLVSCLRENILHHHAILRLKELLFPFFYVMNFLILLVVSALMAADLILILESPENQFTIFKEFCGYFALCWAGEILQEKSSEVKNAVYSMPWYNCCKEFRMQMKILLEFTQKPVELRVSAFNVVLNHESYANAVALGYKLMNALR